MDVRVALIFTASDASRKSAHVKMMKRPEQMKMVRVPEHVPKRKLRTDRLIGVLWVSLNRFNRAQILSSFAQSLNNDSSYSSC